MWPTLVSRQIKTAWMLWCTFNIKRREASPGKQALAKSLSGMVYANDAGVVSQLLEQLRKMMDVMVVVCAASGLTVSEGRD